MHTVEADVVGHLWPCLLGLEDQLLDLFMHCAEESLEGLRPFRIEIPHMERPALAGEDPTEKYHLNHICETRFLLYHIFYALL